jgi:hypothetical protein
MARMGGGWLPPRSSQNKHGQDVEIEAALYPHNNGRWHASLRRSIRMDGMRLRNRIVVAAVGNRPLQAAQPKQFCCWWGPSRQHCALRQGVRFDGKRYAATAARLLLLAVPLPAAPPQPLLAHSLISSGSMEEGTAAAGSAPPGSTAAKAVRLTPSWSRARWWSGSRSGTAAAGSAPRAP